MVVVELKLRNDEKILLASIYCPPQFALSKQALDKIAGIHHRYLIMGDLNAKNTELGGRTTNRSGRILEEWKIDKHLEIIGGALPTFEKGNHREKLDWILGDTHTSLLANSFSVHPQLGTTQSGHLPVTFELTIKPDEREDECARNIYVFEKANWKLYKAELNQRLRQRQVASVHSIDDITEYNTFITRCIVEATNHSVPKANKLRRQQQAKPSTVTLQLIKEKHRLYRKMKNSTSHDDNLTSRARTSTSTTSTSTSTWTCTWVSESTQKKYRYKYLYLYLQESTWNTDRSKNKQSEYRCMYIIQRPVDKHTLP